MESFPRGDVRVNARPLWRLRGGVYAAEGSTLAFISVAMPSYQPVRWQESCFVRAVEQLLGCPVDWALGPGLFYFLGWVVKG